MMDPLEPDPEGQKKQRMEDAFRAEMMSMPLSMPTLGLVGAEPKKVEPPPTSPAPISKSTGSALAAPKHKNKVKVRKDQDGNPKPKRPYNKKRVSETDPLEKVPKKRGRKSKKDLELMEGIRPKGEKQQASKLVKSPKPLTGQTGKISKKSLTKTKKKQSASTVGPSSMFDQKFLVGPHLTMKQVLEYILTDHSYCVPPDPLPAVGSNHQMIRFIFGPKNGEKAKVPGALIDLNGSPIFSSFSRSRGPLSLSSTPPPSSKLENLLKRGDMSPLANVRLSASRNAMDYESDIEIDVEGVDGEPEKRIAYDVQKAREVMNECEKYVEFARGNDTGEDWECKVLRTGWTKSQNGLFEKVVGALHAERLSRLAFKDIGDEEPVLRRTSIDRTACRIRRIFGEYLWDTKLTQWLHGVLNESLNFDYLAMYLDILQTLKSQCPQLVSRMMKLSVILPLQNAYGRENELSTLLTPFLDDEKPMEASELDSQQETAPREEGKKSEPSVTTVKDEPPEIFLPERSVVPQMQDAMEQLRSAKNAEALKALLGRQWDPFSPVLLQRLKKLSSNPIFVYITPGAILPKFSLNRRLKQYERMFRRVGQVVRICPNNSESLKCTSASSYLEKLLQQAKEKIKQLRLHHTDRPLYLVGWGSGSILAARLSVMSGPVDGIVALGFPLHSLREMQDDILKVFNGIKHPILFVIGGLAANNCLTDMDLFRKKLACETSLVVIGSGNENLYVARDHREKMLVTQSYVDKNIVDEIAYFVNLHSKHNQIITANVSMKAQQYPKQANADFVSTKKPPSVPRTKKQKSSMSALDPLSNFDSYNSEDPRSAYDSIAESTSKLSTMKQFSPVSRPYDYDFESPKYVPSKSSNKRKAYYKPDSIIPATSTSTAASITASACLTASQLVQQSPTAKRRMSKPSGPPSTRVPLLGQHSNQRSTLSALGPVPVSPEVSTNPELMKDDSPGLYTPLSGPSDQSHHPTLASLPHVLRQPDAAPVNDPIPSASPAINVDSTQKKSHKKKSNSKKAARLSKDPSVDSPASAIVSAFNEVPTPSISNVQGSIPPSSSLDMHQLVLKHQQMVKQYEQNRSQTSQLFKLLSPGETSNPTSTPSLATPSTSGISGITQSSGDVVKLKLIGSQPISSADLVGDGRTTLISKQSLVSNMGLPMIRLARSGSLTEDNSHPSPVIVTTTASGSTLMSSLPSEVGEKILLRTSNKSIKLNASELKQLIDAGGRGIQLFTTGMTSQGPVNILVKKSQESTDTTSYNPAASITAFPTMSSSSIATFPTAYPTVSADPQQSVGMSQPITASILPVPPPVIQDPGTPLLNLNTTPMLPEISSVLSVGQGAFQDFSMSEMQTNDAAPTEPTGTEMEESMDADTDDEMCGIQISSTFSVCPTSGARVDPAVPHQSDPTSSATFPVAYSIPGGILNVGPSYANQGESISSSYPMGISAPLNSSATEGQASASSTAVSETFPIAGTMIGMGSTDAKQGDIESTITPSQADTSMITLTPILPPQSDLTGLVPPANCSISDDPKQNESASSIPSSSETPRDNSRGIPIAASQDFGTENLPIPAPIPPAVSSTSTADLNVKSDDTKQSESESKASTHKKTVTQANPMAPHQKVATGIVLNTESAATKLSGSESKTSKRETSRPGKRKKSKNAVTEDPTGLTSIPASVSTPAEGSAESKKDEGNGSESTATGSKKASSKKPARRRSARLKSGS